MLQVHSDSRKAYPELFESGVFYYGWRYCLTGNIIGLHETEKGEVSGTARFASGTKVYIAPPAGYRYQNGKNKEEKCSVIGKLRKYSKLVYDIVPLSYIENLRVQKVFNPMVLDMMDWSYDVWWSNRETDKQYIQDLISLLAKEY